MDNKNVVSRFAGIWHQKDKKASTSGLMSKEGEEKWKTDAQTLLSFALGSKPSTHPVTGKTGLAFIVGKTKTFFRVGALEYLEAERINGLDQQALIIQRQYRSFQNHKAAILTARALRRRMLEHRRMAEERKTRKEAEERARREAAAREEEKFAKQMKAELEEFHALLAEEDRKLEEQLEREDAQHQAKLDAERKVWQEKMDREEQEWEAKLARERKLCSDPSGDELANLQAEIAALRKQMEDMDRECAKKLKALDEGCLQAKKEKGEYRYDDKLDGIYLERDVKRQMLFLEAMYENEKSTLHC